MLQTLVPNRQNKSEFDYYVDNPITSAFSKHDAHILLANRSYSPYRVHALVFYIMVPRDHILTKNGKPGGEFVVK